MQVVNTNDVVGILPRHVPRLIPPIGLVLGHARLRQDEYPCFLPTRFFGFIEMSVAQLIAPVKRRTSFLGLSVQFITLLTPNCDMGCFDSGGVLLRQAAEKVKNDAQNHAMGHQNRVRWQF